jgi:hypothetical protein
MLKTFKYRLYPTKRQQRLLSKIGDVKIILHRSLEGTPKDGDHPPHGDGQMVRDHLLRVGAHVFASYLSGGRH